MGLQSCLHPGPGRSAAPGRRTPLPLPLPVVRGPGGTLFREEEEHRPDPVIARQHTSRFGMARRRIPSPSALPGGASGGSRGLSSGRRQPDPCGSRPPGPLRMPVQRGRRDARGQRRASARRTPGPRRTALAPWPPSSSEHCSPSDSAPSPADSPTHLRSGCSFIRMKPPRLGRRRLRLFQGAIPKNQGLLAEAAGRTVRERLLSDEDLTAIFSNREFRDAFDRRLERFLSELLETERGSLRESLPEAAGDTADRPARRGGGAPCRAAPQLGGLSPISKRSQMKRSGACGTGSPLDHRVHS